MLACASDRGGVYRIDEIDANREACAAGGRIVASRAIREVLAGR